LNYDLNILIFGITFGIVFMTIVYTFIRYLYTKEYIYLSYSLMQVFSLIFIFLYSELFIINLFLKELSLLFSSLCAIIFAIGFYEGKFIPKSNTFKELIINTIFLNIVILSSFYHYILFEYLPYTVIYAILFISIIFNLKLNSKPSMIYVIGWSLLCFLLFIMDFKSYYIKNYNFDIVLLAFLIEAILFTLSISYRYGFQQKKSKEYETMLLQQSKLAKSGEMINNITHQFRQPLNNISYILINIKKRFEKQQLDKEYFDKKINQANEQLQFLSKTINDFKEFYTPSKQKETFQIKESLLNANSIISADLKKKNILLSYTFNTNENIQVHGIKNELSQVFVALFSNASDALKDIETPKIDIDISSNIAEVIVSIKNNGKNIKKENLEKIFEAYFSTKKEGSGIGLYMVKKIIENSFKGKIQVSNQKEGVEFTLFLEKAI